MLHIVLISSTGLHKQTLNRNLLSISITDGFSKMICSTFLALLFLLALSAISLLAAAPAKCFILNWHGAVSGLLFTIWVVSGSEVNQQLWTYLLSCSQGNENSPSYIFSYVHFLRKNKIRNTLVVILLLIYWRLTTLRDFQVLHLYWYCRVVMKYLNIIFLISSVVSVWPAQTVVKLPNYYCYCDNCDGVVRQQEVSVYAWENINDIPG